jgi:hypothetical protein
MGRKFTFWYWPLAPSDQSPTRRAMGKWLENVRTKISLALRLLRQKPVRICLFGDENSRAMYDFFTARHPKFPLARRYTFGTALRDLDIPAADLFNGPRFAELRQKVRRARRLGYTVRRFDPQEYLSEIMGVHASSASRQGRAMAPDYLDQMKVAEYCTKPGAWYGVFDAGQSLRGYCHMVIFGDCCAPNRILGHAKSLDDGIMYLLIHEVLGEMHRVKSETGHPRWVMYGMFLGGRQGIRGFRLRCGFEPYRVAWYWGQDR